MMQTKLIIQIHNFCVARATIEKDKYVAPIDLNSDGDFADDYENGRHIKI